MGKHKRPFTMTLFMFHLKEQSIPAHCSRLLHPILTTTAWGQSIQQPALDSMAILVVFVAMYQLFFFITEDYRLFPDNSDFPTSNVFPHSDLDLHPTTVQRSWGRSYTKTTWSPPPREWASILVMWGTEVVSAPLRTAAAAEVLLHQKQEESRYNKEAEIKKASMSLKISPP